MIASSQLFTSLYAVVNRSGILRIPLFYQLFVRAYFLYKRKLDDPFSGLLARNPALLSGGNILDLGANIGYTATLFGKLINAPWKVIAFEPHPTNAKSLGSNVHAFGVSERVDVVVAAVGDRDGETVLWENSSHHADHRILTADFEATINPVGQRIRVPVYSLDSWYSKHYPGSPISFIKIDVQGYELPVLRGLSALIERNQGVAIAIEYAEKQLRELGFAPEETLTFLRSRGFELSFISKHGDLIPLTETIIRGEISSRGYLDILAKRNSK